MWRPTQTKVDGSLAEEQKQRQEIQGRYIELFRPSESLHFQRRVQRRVVVSLLETGTAGPLSGLLQVVWTDVLVPKGRSAWVFWSGILGA